MVKGHLGACRAGLINRNHSMAGDTFLLMKPLFIGERMTQESWPGDCHLWKETGDRSDLRR